MQTFDNSASLVIGAGAGRLDNWQVRYNAFENAPDVANLSGDGDSEWKGNLGGGNGCIAAFTYSYNVGETCGGTGEVPISPAVNTASHPDQAPFYADAPDDDFHLVSGADAIDAGDPDDYPATDVAGAARRTPDAGAYAYIYPANLWIDNTAGSSALARPPPARMTTEQRAQAHRGVQRRQRRQCDQHRRLRRRR